ncbi:MAG TPA: sialidase family protein [Candidatus Brocadiia bacterium]|nr:sialidase family protein [Candidatus Brocadiia bacterium]
MERYIAIDNVCAWPNLTKMPDGEVVATIFNQPCHGRWEGDVECWASKDGRFWRKRGVPAPHEPGTVRMNVAAGLAANGDLVVIASGWHGGQMREGILQAWVCRSTDSGRTWQRAETFPVPEGMGHVVPFGDIIVLPDGALGVCGYGSFALGQGPHASFFYKSRDDGRTWAVEGRIAEGVNETTPLCPDGKRILAAARSQALSQYVSDDLGATWRLDQQLTGIGCFPGQMIKLSDGRCLLVHGIRTRGFYGVGALISPDSGARWEAAMTLVDLPEAVDGGYPASVELDDGQILTAYYASGVPYHQRYHMGVVLWSIEEQARANRPPENNPIHGGAFKRRETGPKKGEDQ